MSDMLLTYINYGQKEGIRAVSYTHLDVYKRQAQHMLALMYKWDQSKHGADLFCALHVVRI